MFTTIVVFAKNIHFLIVKYFHIGIYLILKSINQKASDLIIINLFHLPNKDINIFSHLV